MTHNNFTYKKLLRDSYELTKKHFLFLLGLLAINMVIGWIISPIPLVNQLVSIILSIATVHIMLMLTSGHTPLYKDMLTPFKNYKTTWHYFLAVLFMFLLFLLGASVVLVGYAVSAVTSSFLAVGVSGFIFLLLVIYYGIRLSFFRYFILEDESLAPEEALKKSFRLTANRFWKIVGFVGVLFLLNLAGLLALVVGLLFTLPMTWIATALLYKALKGHRPPHDGPHIATA